MINVSQAVLMDRILPLLKSKGGRYKKAAQVRARPAVAGEKVVSVTSDGRETVNTAAQGDHVVMNATEAKELYIISDAKFKERYEIISAVDDTWALYQARGEILAIEIDGDVLNLLEKNSSFQIMASWGEPQVVHPNDYFVSPLPDLQEIYRIARKEFGETYRLVE